MPDETQGKQVPGFVIHGTPRSKKNSPRIVNIGPMCRACGKRGGFPKVLPSLAYEEWEAAAVRECMTIKAALRAAGIELPIAAPIHVEALFYLLPTKDGRMRADCPDVSNLQEAVGDMLETAGIILNDRQIEDWDGTRRRLDAANPRVEIFIEILATMPVQETIFTQP